MELLHADPSRALERENRELREELRKRHEQQCIMEQIVANVSSLLEGSTEAMCIFDKDGHFLHLNAPCRRLLGLMENQHSPRMTLFEYYAPWDRDRVIREFFSKSPAHKWSGMVKILNKHTGQDTFIMQTIETIPTKHHSSEIFFKSYFQPQERDTAPQDKLRMYNDMIHHMPHGVGIWRLERGMNTPAVVRLVCANKMASQYVGVPLLPGALIHEVIPTPAGVEVHRFLEDVVRSQRVITLDNFRIGPHHAFSVTAYPLYPELVVVVMDPPKNPSQLATPSTSTSAPLKEKEPEWASVIGTSGLAVATCEGVQAIHVNEHFAAMIAVPQAYVGGRDVLAVLESRVRQGSRVHIEQLRRAVRERVIHHVEIELEQYAWRLSVHPMAEGTRQMLIVGHRTRALTPQAHHTQRPMFPILPSSFASPSSSSPAIESKSFLSDSNIFKDVIDRIPCGIVVVKKDDGNDFRVVSVNQSAKSLAFTKGLTQGHIFDETSSPFDPSFVRAMHASSKSSEGRVAYSVEGGKGGARIIPLNDLHVALIFEDAGLFEFPAVQEAPRNTSSKRAIADLVGEVDHGYHIFPGPAKFMRNHCKTEREETSLPFSKLSGPTLPPIQSHFSASAVSSTAPASTSSRVDKLERLFQACVIGIACLDSTGAITMANKAFGQLAGLSESELSQLQSSQTQLIADLVHPDDSNQARNVVRQITNGELHSFDMPLRFLTQNSRTVVWGVACFMSAEKGVVLQVLQPTRLKHFPEVLMSDRDVLRSAFRELVVGSAVLSVEDSPKIVSANSGFCAIMAAPEGELAGHAVLDTIHEGDHASVLAAAREVCAARTLRSPLLSVRSNPKSGPERYGALALSAILDSQSRPFLIIAQLQLVDKPFS